MLGLKLNHVSKRGQFTFFSQWGRCDRSELKTRSDDRKREPEVTVTMAAATGSGSTGGPWGRDLRAVPEIGFGDVARVVEQESQAPKTSLSKGYKFFADSYVHDVEGKLNTSSWLLTLPGQSVHVPSQLCVCLFHGVRVSLRSPWIRSGCASDCFVINYCGTLRHLLTSV